MADNDKDNQELDNQGTGKTYTQSELDSMISKAIDSHDKKKSKEYESKLKESEKLAKMNAEERAEHERKQYEKQLEDKEKELNIRENKIEGYKILAEKNIPASLIDFVIDPDAEIMNERIKLLDKEIKKAVAAEVKTKIASPSPKVAVTQSGEITKEQFLKMGIPQRTELFKNNPDLYKELSK